jgi:hypothetical protein
MSSLIGLAYNFWSLTRNSIDEMEKQGNAVAIFSTNLNESDSWQNYELKTKWNDNNIGVPILFNFYHGLELYMKGLLELKNIEVASTHNLKSLFETKKANETLYSEPLVSLLSQHILDSKIEKSFFEPNGLSMSDFYICFRYPKNNKGNKMYQFQNIRGGVDETMKAYKSLRKSTIDFYDVTVDWLSQSNDSENHKK